MANNKSLLTTLNENQPNILFVENGGGGGHDYVGDAPITIDAHYHIGFNELNCTGLTSLSANDTTIFHNIENINDSLSSLEEDYNSFTADLPNTYVRKNEYNAYTGTINNTITGLTDNINTLNTEIDNITDTIDTVSSLLDYKADLMDLEELSAQVEINTSNIENINDSITTINSNISTLTASTATLRNDLNDIDDTVKDIVSAVNDINEELPNKISFTALNYDTEINPNYISGINNLPIYIPGVAKNIYMWNGDISTDPIELNEHPNYQYSKYIPFASADNPDLDISGSPGVISIEDKTKLDNIVMLNSDSADMQLTYVGENSGTSTFLGYYAGSLGFYDLNCTVESAMQDPSIMEDENNWSEHPFGISPDLYNMLRTLSAILSESGQHPYGMIGMTSTGLGWVDLN